MNFEKESEQLDRNTSVKKETIIEVNNLRKGFPEQEVLKNVSFSLTRGENLVVLGKSGSGKSVLIKCIVRLMEADEGKIMVLGKELRKLNSKELAELRKEIGFLFQNSALYDSMNVKQNIEFPLKRIRKDLNKKQRNEKIDEVLENVGLQDSLYKMPSQLSGGMRKRISLARTIAVDPQIILYDEPTTGLDPLTSDEISKLINEVKQKYKTSSLIITHDIECARTTADRLILLKDGEIYTEGTLDKFENSDDELIKMYFK
jgi:phospholipid/cholesterol/gamma-HCH transport system ATP-binding protein